MTKPRDSQEIMMPIYTLQHLCQVENCLLLSVGQKLNGLVVVPFLRLFVFPFNLITQGIFFFLFGGPGV
jgi:uncharacterized membrane protein YvlD (DUF360 family)